MKLIPYSLTLIVLVFLLSGVTIQFKPFSFRFTHPVMALGIILIIVGICCIYASGDKTGYKKAIEDLKAEITNNQSKP